jgi:sugar phosphate permease
MAETTDASPSPVRTGTSWYVLTVLMLVYAVNFMDRQLFAVLQERIRDDIGLQDWQLGLLGGTMFALFYAVLGVPIAWFADRTHRIRLIAMAATLWSGFTALTGMAQGFVHLAAARIGVAVGEAGGVAPSYSVLSDFFAEHRRGFAIGVFSVGAPLGLTAGTLLGAMLADALSWRAAFYILALPGIVLAVLMVLTIREPARGQMDSAAPAQQKVTPDAPLASRSGTLAAFAHMVQTPALFMFAAAAASTSFAGYALYQWVPSFLQRSQGMSLDAVGMYLSPVFLFGMAGAVAGGWLADRFAPKVRGAYGLVPGIAQLVATPLFIIALLAGSGMATILLLIVPTLLSYVWLGPTLAAAQNLSHPGIRASVAAIIALINNLLGFGLGPLAIGSLSSALTPMLGAGEALRVSLLAGISLYLVGALCFLAAAHLERRRTA